MSNLPTAPFVAKDNDEILRELLEHVIAGMVTVDNEEFTTSGLGPYTLACGSPDISDGDLITISRVWGERGNSFNEFIVDIDYTVDYGNNQITFVTTNDPDDATNFYVSYKYDQKSTSGLTDINQGSVVRTLLDGFSRQIGAAYRSLELVKAAAFIETAEGSDLDELLKLVGITRNTAAEASGYASFYREATGSTQTVTTGTRVSANTGGGDVIYETTSPATFAIGYSSVRAPIEASASYVGKVGNMAANRITRILTSGSPATRVNNPSYYKDYEFVQLVGGNYGYQAAFQPRRKIGSSTFFGGGGDWAKGFIGIAAGGGKDLSISTSNWSTFDVTLTEGDPETGYTKCTPTATTGYLTRTFPVLDLMDQRYGYVFLRAKGTQDDTFQVEVDGSTQAGVVWGSSTTTNDNVLASTWQFYGFQLDNTITNGVAPLAIISRTNAQPTAPLVGKYMAGTSVTGGDPWAGLESQIHEWDGGAWLSGVTCDSGRFAYLIGAEQGVEYSGTPATGWTDTASIGVQVSFSTTNPMWLDLFVTGKRMKEVTTPQAAADEVLVNYTGKRFNMYYATETDNVFYDINTIEMFDGDDTDNRSDDLFVWYEWNNNVSGGTEEETDDRLRVRGRSALAVSAKGTKDAIKNAVLDVDGITQAQVLDYNDDDGIQPGECHVFILAGGFTVSPSLGQQVVAAIDEVRAAGIYVKVFAPMVRYTNFDINVVYDDALSEYLGSGGQATLTGLIETGINDFFSGATINKPLYFSELAGFLIREVKGVLAAYVDWDDATEPTYSDDDINGTYTYSGTVIVDNPKRVSGIRDLATIVVQRGNNVTVTLERGSANL